MRRNPTLMTVCGLNPARKRAPLRSRLGETGCELGGTALRSIVGAAASLAAGPLIKKLAGGALMNPGRMMLLTAADRKRLPPLYSQEKLGMNAIAQVKFFTPRLPIERDRYFRPTPLSQLPQSNPRRRNPGTVGSALLAGATSAVVGRMLRNPGRRNPAVDMPMELRQAVAAAARSGIYSAVPYAQLLLSGDTMYDDPMGTLLYLKSNLSYWRGPEAAAAKAVIAKYAKKPVRTWMSNPGPSRKTTVPISKFAGWVKSQRNPALMADFRKKIAAYKKWTHGSLPTKVSVEKINSPGLNGMIIATGLGKSPESTYIMPSGSKRGGAWKHKWETMPDMADAGSGLIVTKMRGKSRITDFMRG